MNARFLSIFAVLAAATLSAPGPGAAAQEKPMKMMMGDIDMSAIPQIPPVAGYAAGERIFFVHTEVSDPGIGKIMTEMMGSPVPVVPILAKAPEEMLATVYVFANGLQPDGPRGPLDYQPDVFDHPPGTAGYTPLRKIVIVTWRDGATPRILKSAAEVTAALQAGDVSVEEPGVVANMPFVTWPGGQR